jgi:hypothetical protein
MKTKDLFKVDRSARRINESIEKVFGRKINLEAFDLDQLQDARNKIRTQLSQQRASSGFNENVENDAYTKAQWMLDAINAEISHREEFIVDDVQQDDDDWGDDEDDEYDGHAAEERYKKWRKSRGKTDEAQDPNMSKAYQMGHAAQKAGNKDALKTIPQQYKQMWVKGWEDGENLPKEEFEFESQDKGNEMKRLRESEIDQASAIVTANTMVDRLGRWIEELSGMENETLLELGDSIRDQMGQEQSRQFIEAVAPAIQSALETLKAARETVSGAVRTLATGESPDAMLGAPAEPEMDMPAPDAMNAGDLDIGPEDDFDAAEPAAGGIETAGRAKRESIDFQNRLLKVLAG